jgi:hypothetical protein
MDLMKYLLATLLMAYSSQSMALFMPEGFNISTDVKVESDSGCGVADMQRGDLLTR